METKDIIELILLSILLILMLIFPGAGFLYSPKYKLQNLKWRFHKADEDDIICIPHGHNIDGKEKLYLNPYTGIIYHKKEEKGRLKSKEFTRLWSDEKFLAFVNEARAVYLESKPNATLPDIPKVVGKKKSRDLCENINEQECEIELVTEILNPNEGE